jgi:hypothetical protein
MLATQIRSVQSALLQLFAAAGILLGIQSVVLAVGWSDNFNDGSVTDGNPVSWLNDLGGSGLFPGDYNASSGDFVLTPQPDGTNSSIMISLVPSVGFTDVYMRTQGIVLPDPLNPTVNKGGNLVLLGRVDPVNLNGYLVYFDVSGNLNLQILAGGATADIGTTFDAPFNASSEVVVEMDIVGDQLSAYAWLADDPNGKPATPQVTATDPNFTSGVSGIAFAEDDDLTAGVFRYASAQSTPFVDGVPGDYNKNGVVDAGDYVLWRNGGPLANEIDSPGTVNGADYTAWRARFGNTSGSGAGSGIGAAAIPEPTAVLLVAAGLGACLMTVRRRSWR